MSHVSPPTARDLAAPSTCVQELLQNLLLHFQGQGSLNNASSKWLY